MSVADGLTGHVRSRHKIVPVCCVSRGRAQSARPRNLSSDSEQRNEAVERDGIFLRVVAALLSQWFSSVFCPQVSTKPTTLQQQKLKMLSSHGSMDELKCEVCFWFLIINPQYSCSSKHSQKKKKEKEKKERSRRTEFETMMIISLSKWNFGTETKWPVSWLGNPDGRSRRIWYGFSPTCNRFLQPWRFTSSLPYWYDGSEPQLSSILFFFLLRIHIQQARFSPQSSLEFSFFSFLS